MSALQTTEIKICEKVIYTNINIYARMEKSQTGMGKRVNIRLIKSRAILRLLCYIL